ncbi:hypothetical protein CASFOL_033093 [Castilleja foliolosa]|uniref:KIB1-4 beta-propeller domain-containing protein n=1 Tax=Castilleja foliolosa TaxID=1961234 RepID=A0ABD3C3Z9_9LAMI
MSSSSRFLFRPIFHRSSNYLVSKSPTPFKSLIPLSRRYMSTAAAAAFPCLISKSPTPFKSLSPLSHRQLSTTAAASDAAASPCLMLPPSFKCGVINHNFYSLEQNKVITLAGSREKELAEVLVKPFHHRALKGSSHGYLALFDEDSLDLFLYNPISKRYIKLPLIRDLPNTSKKNYFTVTKVILSCSPDEDYENCRAIMMYNCSLLAFCLPWRSDKWTSFGRFPDGYKEIVYSSENHLLFGLTNKDKCLESWDLRDFSSPTMVMSTDLYSDNNGSESKDEEKLMTKRLESEDWYALPEEDRPCYFRFPEDRLVVANYQLLLVTRYMMGNVAPDGSYVDCHKEEAKNCPHFTIDFDVHKYNPEKGNFTHLDWLVDLALFVGGLESDTFALPVSSCSGLKANSVYFTDSTGTSYWKTMNGICCDYAAPFGGHDIGIFDYENKTISSCYYPCDVESVEMILPSPMWFFPSSPI